jgi:hypothetical protein
LEKLKTASTKKLLDWFRVYLKRKDWESIKKISIELQQRHSIEEKPLISKRLNESDIKNIIDAVTFPPNI